jgi:ferric-dicitrate binding protein FerR (iron transport regulator)
MSVSDTSTEVRARMERHYRDMTPVQRIQRAVALTAASHEMALAVISSRHPVESRREHRLRLLSRILSREQMLAAFGWDSALHGP